VEKYVAGEQLFLANYSDGVSDLPLQAYLDYVTAKDRIASFLGVRPQHSMHVVSLDSTGLVNDIQHARDSRFLVNGGFFAFKPAIFDHIAEGEELVEAPFRRLIDKGELVGYPYDGFWAPMDTLKDKQQFDSMELRGETPWAVWKRDGRDGTAAVLWPEPLSPAMSTPDAIRAPSHMGRRPA